mmetsp:Transcript_6054/g.13293  ORF Transcript_6054/g.13293 Transcript_6054/m.13293 type:complete len:80 (-) Transcript_6054:563-802(-)
MSKEGRENQNHRDGIFKNSHMCISEVSLSFPLSFSLLLCMEQCRVAITSFDAGCQVCQPSTHTSMAAQECENMTVRVLG